MWLETLRQRWFGKSKARKQRRGPQRRSQRSATPWMEVLEDRTVPTLTLTVGNGDVGTLINDIQTANVTTSQPVVISLASNGTYDVGAVNNTTNGPNGLPVIVAPNLTIEGNGATLERSLDAGTPNFRLFDLARGANVTLQDLTITGGKIVGAPPVTPAVSGIIGVYSGPTYSPVPIPGRNGSNGSNGADGANAQGGAIYATDATLILSAVKVTDNTVVGGTGGFGGAGARGGPAYAGGTGGNGGNGGNGGHGGQAYGGGLYLLSSTLTIENNSRITGNQAVGGPGGLAGSGGPGGLGGNGNPGVTADPQGGPGGPGGNGGNGGLGGSGGAGGQAAGGGLYALHSTIAIVQGSLTNNNASGGPGGSGGRGGPGGAGGMGGEGGAPLSFFAINGPGGPGGNGGNGGNAGNGGNGGNALAGGVYTAGGPLLLLTATVSSNTVTPGPGGPSGDNIYRNGVISSVPIGPGGYGGARGIGGAGDPMGSPGVPGQAGKGGLPGAPGFAGDNPNILRDAASAPLFLNSSQFTFLAGQSNTFVVNTFGYPLPSLTEAGALPSGVTFTDNGDGTATLSGTPTAASAGTYTLTFTAQNGVSPNATQTFTLVVQGTPGIISPGSATFTVGQAGRVAISTTGYPAATLTESGALPAGVTLQNNGNGTAILQGTPLPGSGGTYTFTLTAQNGLPTKATQTFTLTVDEAPRISSSSQAVFDPSSDDSFTVTTFGFPQPTLTESGALPGGIAFTDNGNGTATLGGTPAADTGGFYHFTITAHNGAGANASQNFTLLVGQAPSFDSYNFAYFAAGQSGSYTISTTATPTAVLTESGTLPPSFTFTDNGDGTATLSGDPAAGATGTYDIDVLANNGLTASQQLTISLGQGPSFTNADVATFTVGQSSSFTISTGGTSPVDLSNNTYDLTLPQGLSFTDNGDGTGTINGTPAAGTAGSYDLTLTADNNFGTTSQDFTLNIGQGLAITTADNGTLTVGQHGSITISTSGSPTPTLTESGSLPQGVTFTDHGNGTATLSGTPAAGTSNTYALTLTAHNGTSPDFVQNYTLTVQDAPQFTRAASTTFAVGNAGDFFISTSGLPSATLTETGALPSGVAFYPDDGDGGAELYGTPAAGTAGTYNITLTAHNGIGSDATQNFTLTVGDFTSSSTATFTVGTAGSFTVATTGFPTPVSLSISYLPSGLNFTDNGNGTATLSGTPDADTAGSYPISIYVSQDSNTLDTQNFVLTVDDAPQFNSDNNATFIANASNGFTVSTYGLPVPALTESGALPSGVSFTDNGDGTATLGGTPPATALGTYNFTIAAQNDLGSDTQDFSLTVGTGVVFTGNTSATFLFSQNNSFTVTTAGSPTAALTEAGDLPSGVTFTDNGDGTGTFSGIPAAGSSNDYSVSVTADDGIDSPVTEYLDIFVYAPTQITSSASTSFAAGQSNTFTVTTTSDPNLGVPSLTETGNLPSGVFFSDNGDGTATLSGTPDTGTNGTYPFTITASEGGNVPNATQNFSLVVGTPPQISSASSAVSTRGAAGSFTVTTTGSPTSTLTESGALPSGVTFTDNGDGTATLGGTPAAGTTGTYKLTLTAANGIGSDATQTFTLTISQAPAITSGNSATFSVGQSGTFTVTSTGSPTASLTEAGALPGGVTFTDNGNGTATFSGTPAAGTGGYWSITLTAHNGASPDATQSFTLNVDAAPEITSTASTVFAIGAANTFTVTTYSFPAPTLTETGALPSGVTFTDNGDHTATLSGTPTATEAGIYNFTITAHNGIGSAATQNFLLLVGQAPTITSADTAVFGVGRSGSFTVTSTGLPLAALTESGTLPAGITFKDDGNGTATLAGTPAAGTTGVYPITLTAHNGVGSDALQNFFLQVGQAPTITSAASATFGSGGPGSFTITTTGSPPPSLSEAGTLPSGLTFTDNGDGTATLGGTPATGTNGTYDLILTANNGVGANVTQRFTLTVAGQAPAITSGSSSTFTVGQAGSFTVATTGSPTASLTEAGALPGGVTFKDNGNGSATLSGTPAAGSSGTYNLAVTAAASGSSSSTTQDFTLTVNDAPQITSAASTVFAVGAANSFTVTTYGLPIPSLSESGALPQGVGFTDNGNGTATLNGIPAAGSAGTYNLTLTAHNVVGSNATQSFTLTVAAVQAPAITSAASAAFTAGQAGSFTVTTTGVPTARLTEAGVLPQGVSFTDNGDGTATLSGTPAAGTAGTYALALTAANGTSPDATRDLILTVSDAPQITSAASTIFAATGGPFGTGGAASTFTVTTYGFPAPSLTESGALPSGVTFTDNGNGTATLSGMAVAGSDGTYHLTLTAHNGIGSNATQSFTLVVTEPPGEIFQSNSSTTFIAGQFDSFEIATDSPQFHLTETGALPGGVSFTDNGNGTATLSSTPAAGPSGIYELTVTAANSSDTGTQQFFLTVDGPPSFTSANSTTFFANEAGFFTVTAGGLPNATVTATGALPSGVTVSSYAGEGVLILSGIPEPGTTGTYNLVITARNTLGSTTQDFTLNVAPAPSAVFTFTENQDGSATIISTVSGTPTLTEAGALPGGVTFTDNGNGTATLSGAPQPGTQGTYLFTVTAAGTSPSQTQSYLLLVDGVPQITNAASTFFTLGTDNSFLFAAQGFPSPTLTETGTLPSGVTFFDYGSSAYVSGTPAAGTAGTYNLTIAANNGVGSAVTQDFTLVVGESPSINSANIPNFTVGQEGSFTITTTGDNPPLTLTASGILPGGVTFTDNGDGTATLAGVPATGSGGNYDVVVTASNGFTTTTQNFGLYVMEAPSITSGNASTFVPGFNNSFTITATGSTPLSLTESGALPSGVSFTDNGFGTATLSGTAAAGTNGTYPLVITASNGIGTDATQDFTLTVGAGLAFTSQPAGTLTDGQNGSITITAIGSATPTLTETGALPADVSFQDNGNGSATLAGTPAAGTGGTYDLTITAHDGVDADASQSFVLTVDEAPQFISSDTIGLIVGQSSTGEDFFVATGFPSPTLTESGALPSGITFTDNGGGYASLDGTATSAGTYHLVITAANGIGADATRDVTLYVGQQPAITSAASVTFTVGKSGSFTVTTSGSPAPSVSESDPLPGGLTFTDNGNGTATLSGTPAAGTGGTYTLDFLAQNVVGSSNDQFFTLNIDEAPQITSNANATLVLGQDNSFAVTTRGFPAPSLTEAGSLPTGVTFRDDGEGTAYFSGVAAPGTIGTYPLTITANGGAAGKATQNFTLTVDQDATLTSTPATTFTVGQSGSFTITAAGSPTDQLTERGPLPAGLTFTDDGNNTATLSGTPAAGTGGAYLLALTAQNGVGLNATQNFILFVNQGAAITSADNANLAVGQAGSFTVHTTGSPAPSLSETGALPSGVSFTDNGDGTATLGGTPAVGSAGTYNLTLTAHNGVGNDATQGFTLTVGQGQAPAITSGNATVFTVGQAGSFNVTTTGAPTPSLTESGALPSGVTFQDNGDGTATLLGTPAAGSAGSYNLTLTAHNGVGNDATQSFTLTVEQLLAITSSSATTFTAGQSGNFVVRTTGFPAPALTESGALPGGVTFTDNGDGTATLSGTPALTTGAYTFNVTVSNGVTPAVTQVFTLTVIDPPTITSAASTTFLVGKGGSFTVTTTAGLPATTTLSKGGTLPGGVSFIDNGNGTGTIKGTPAAGSSGSYVITLTASNAAASQTIQTFTLTVDQGPAISSAGSATFRVGQTGTFTVTTTGFPTAALSKSGTLPGGVTFTDNGNGTATLSGTPAAGSSGPYSFTITASNGVTPAATQTFALTVDQPPAITSANNATFTVGQAGSFTVTTTAGFPATTTLSKSGTLPSGITFTANSNGTATIKGTPAAGTGGTYSITLTASNAPSSQVTQAFTLTVDQAPTITSAASATFVVGQTGRFTVTTKGFPTAALSESGTLPSGVTFTDHGNGTATLSGTPAAGTASAVPYSFTITASNGITPAATQTFKLTVDQPPVITSANNATFTVGKAGSFTVTTTAGLPATTTLSKSGTLPSGVTFTANSNGTATIKGTPAAGTGGTYSITLTASNAPSSQVTQTFTLTVDQAPAISSAASTTFAVGQTGTFTVTTKGFPTAALSESGTLPSGVTFTDHGNGTASLSGIPAAGTSSAVPYSFTITASNGIAPATTQTFKLIVDQPPAITSANNATFTVGKAGSFTVTTTAGLPATTTLSKSGTLPSGVTLTANSNGTATIKGTPAAGTGGSYTLTLTASNAPSSQTAQTFTLNVDQAPAISSAASATFRVGQTGTFTVTTTGFPTAALSESGTLPGGVTFTDNGNGTATLSGTPASGSSGPYSLTITASNGITPAATQTFKLTVDQPPAITSANNATFTVGKASSFTVTTTPGVPATTTLSVTGKLPSGVTFIANSNGTATLHGTPAAGTGGTYSITFTASNAPSSQVTQTFTLTVDQAPAISSAASTTFAVGQTGIFTVTTKGFPTAALSESGTLPGGVTFTDNGNGTATLSGTPAADTASAVPYSLTITANNGIAPAATQTFKLTVDQPPAITSANNATFTVGKAGSFTVTTTPGLPATTTLSASGKLPSGVTLTANSNGTATIKGTPAAGTGGSYSITLTASNAPSSQTTQTFTLNVDQAPAISSAASATFRVGQAGSLTVTTTGFPAAALSESGTLPNGVTFVDNGNGTATLSGTPWAGSGGSYAFTIGAGNSVAAVTQKFTLTVDQPPLITSADSVAFSVNQANSFTITTTGFPVATITESGALPSGVTLVDHKNGTALLSGKPTVKGSFTFTIVVSDGLLPEALQSFDLTVA